MNIGLNPSQIPQAVPGFNQGPDGVNISKTDGTQGSKGFGDLLLRKFESNQASALNDLRSVGEVGAVRRQGRTSMGSDSGGVVGEVIRAVDAKQKEAKATRTAFLTGESGNLHQTMIASQEASVSFTLMVEMRNKVLEAYQELMRIQV